MLIRHAKSSWANPAQTDFERPLNERGEHDAPMMGERLKKASLLPDLIVSSPAKRARQTAAKIGAAVGYSKDRIHMDERLYHCTPAVFEEVISELDNGLNTVFIVAHNPGITNFVNDLSDKFHVDNMPTCALAAVHGTVSAWPEFSAAEKEVFLFEYPKQFYDSK